MKNTRAACVISAAIALGSCNAVPPEETQSAAQAPAASTLTRDAVPALIPSHGTSTKPTVVVYKSPTCGCCSQWVEHMRTNGFDVAAHDVEDINAVKRKHGVPANLDSCHTGIVGGYVIEGHVPAEAVQRLLRERPASVAGIAVPGMPVGSPGMEAGDRKEPYVIASFDKAGNAAVYERR